MAQAFLTYENKMRMQRMNHYENKSDAATQTGSDNVDILYHLPNNKMIRLYYSNIYKEKVVSFNISAAKSFIINKEIWQEMRTILPQIDNFLKK